MQYKGGIQTGLKLLAKRIRENKRGLHLFKFVPPERASPVMHMFSGVISSAWKKRSRSARNCLAPAHPGFARIPAFCLPCGSARSVPLPYALSNFSFSAASSLPFSGSSSYLMLAFLSLFLKLSLGRKSRIFGVSLGLNPDLPARKFYLKMGIINKSINYCVMKSCFLWSCLFSTINKGCCLVLVHLGGQNWESWG